MEALFKYIFRLLFPPKKKVRRYGSRYIPNDVKAEAMRRYGGRCAWCGAITDLHFDHIVPYSRGGTSHVDNIQILCGYHNRLKSNRY